MMIAEILERIYHRLYDHFGPQQWWPGDTPFEVMVGAVLTQNTNWQNVEKAIENLKGVGLLELEKLAELPAALLAEYIRPAGYYNVKAGRLHNLCTCVREFGDGDLASFLGLPTDELRELLLSVKGIGPETADCILLYAAEKPAFVVDAYTHRILSRHNLIGEEYGYGEIRDLFMDNLKVDVPLYNEYHALLVRAGKEFCRKSRPDCDACPLKNVEAN